MIPEDPNDELPPNLGAKVGFLASVILSIGYIVGTISDGIELTELARAEEIEKKAAKEQQQQISEIQKKLDYLVNEMEELKKRG